MRHGLPAAPANLEPECPWSTCSYVVLQMGGILCCCDLRGGVLDRRLVLAPWLAPGRPAPGQLFAQCAGVRVGITQQLRHDRELARHRQLMGIIADMNHHTRNALQVIVSRSVLSMADSAAIEDIRQAVGRIDWCLREILPGADETTALKTGSAPATAQQGRCPLSEIGQGSLRTSLPMIHADGKCLRSASSAPICREIRTRQHFPIREPGTACL